MNVLAEVGIVTLISVLLILSGVGLFGLTIWFWKNSRPEPPALARLEVMSERAYRKSKGVDRQFLLQMAEREARESATVSSSAETTVSSDAAESK